MSLFRTRNPEAWDWGWPTPGGRLLVDSDADLMAVELHFSEQQIVVSIRYHAHERLITFRFAGLHAADLSQIEPAARLPCPLETLSSSGVPDVKGDQQLLKFAILSEAFSLNFAAPPPTVEYA